MAFKEKVYHKEENCLNCGYPLIGKYCGNCGQKAFLHKDSFWHMVTHFAGDYFHYDSKFWITFKTLFTKPGLATLEYNNGKRAKYLNPIQLYIFVSTVFFLLVFMKPSSEPLLEEVDNPATNQVDSLKPKSKIVAGFSTEDGVTQIGIGDWTPKQKTIEEYNASQDSLSTSQRDGMFKRKVIEQSFKIQIKYKHNFSEVLNEIFFHNIPKVFFILLPYFAFLLWLFFKSKKHYYVDHLIFSFHFHSVLFLTLTFTKLIYLISHEGIFYNFFRFFIVVFLTVYLFISLKRVYHSKLWKIVFKQIFIFSIYFIGLIFSMLILLGITFLIM